MTDCQDQGVSFGLTLQQEMEIVRNTIGLAQMSDFLERIRGQQARIEQLEAEAQAAAAQTARLCRDLADLARAAKDQSEIAYEAGYERGYEDAIATRQVALDDEYQRGWDAGFAYGESREPRR